MYVPYWTYDSDTTSFYRGQRGDHYWVTQHYTTQQNGKTVHKTRQVRKTRWYPASGTCGAPLTMCWSWPATACPENTPRSWSLGIYPAWFPTKTTT